MKTGSRTAFIALLAVFLVVPFFSCVSSAAKAEEYYTLGTAYFELKKYAEAEAWFNKSKFHRTTKTASEYNLGRIAYETGRYDDALLYFKRVLETDGENITALKAAAYTCIKTEELEQAEDYYRQVLALVPESYDDGYNYALVLLALGRAAEAEEILVKYNNTETPQALLLLARAQKNQGKPEAADAYQTSLLKENNVLVRQEYAAYLNEAGLPARALEEYKKALEAASDEQKESITSLIEALEADVQSSAEGKH
ncbi:hypothetical protein AGMMS50230_20830 [Spirochaetia bacterium]|nr:hypothetical protein AGMMS50230_20830 [Spirochaetia bacterium]